MKTVQRENLVSGKNRVRTPLKIPIALVYMKYGVGFDRAIDTDEEKWRFNQCFQT